MDDHDEIDRFVKDIFKQCQQRGFSIGQVKKLGAVFYDACQEEVDRAEDNTKYQTDLISRDK